MQKLALKLKSPKALQLRVKKFLDLNGLVYLTREDGSIILSHKEKTKSIIELAFGSKVKTSLIIF